LNKKKNKKQREKEEAKFFAKVEKIIKKIKIDKTVPYSFMIDGEHY